MESIIDNFSRFFAFSSSIILKFRTSQLPSHDAFPLSFPREEGLPASLDSSPQLFVLEFFLSEKKSKANQPFLIEQWIFDLHPDKVPQRSVRSVGSEREIEAEFRSIAKMMANLLVNLPVYREYLNKACKYSSQISHDFALSHRVVRNAHETSNFQGWNSHKWNQYYTKFPPEDEISFYVNSKAGTFKFSFQLNYFKNIYDLYKLVDPIKQNLERNRIRSISEQLTKIGKQREQKVGLITYESTESNEFIQWASKNSVSFNDSLDENALILLTPKSYNCRDNDSILKNSSKISNDMLPTPLKRGQNQPDCLLTKENGSNLNKNVFKGLLYSIRHDGKPSNRDTGKKNEGAFVVSLKRRDSQEQSLVNLIEAFEKRRLNVQQKGKEKTSIAELISEIKGFNERLE